MDSVDDVNTFHESMENVKGESPWRMSREGVHGHPPAGVGSQDFVQLVQTFHLFHGKWRKMSSESVFFVQGVNRHFTWNWELYLML